MNSRRLLLTFAVVGLILAACSRTSAPEKKEAGVPGPRCIVYRTKADYASQVPVILSADKKTIVSYPGIGDLKTNGRLALPDLLEGGYLLDNRGIGPDVAFLRLTYEEYELLPATPTAAELFNQVLDKDPLAEMYDCGPRNRFQDPVEEMNRLIRSGGLPAQKRLK